MEYRHRIRKHHWGNFRCPICGDKDVWSARTVLDHMQAKHQSKTEDLECPECKKDIPALDIEEHYPKCIMQNNVCINRGKRMCDLCGKMINMGTLAKHKRKHARRPDDNHLYHQCDLCDKKFTEKGTLKRHKKQFLEGGRYPCNNCDATYDTLSEGEGALERGSLDGRGISMQGILNI